MWERVIGKDGLTITYRKRVPGGWLYEIHAQPNLTVVFIPLAEVGKYKL